MKDAVDPWLSLSARARARESAQALAEELVLKGMQVPDGWSPSDPAQRQAYQEWQSQQAALLALDAQIEALERRLRAGAAQNRPGEPTQVEGRQDDDQDLAELKDDRLAAHGAYQDMIVRLKREYPEIAQYFGEPLNLRELQPYLAEDQRIVQYLLLEDEGWVFVISDQRPVAAHELGVGRRQIEPLVMRYRSLLRDWGHHRARPISLPHEPAPLSADALEGQSRQVLAELAHHLLQPLVGQLDGVRSLLVIPNGPLHVLPFAALPWKDGFLVEGFEIHRFSSASELLTLARRGQSVESSRVLVLGNPTPPEPEWGPLPWAEEEAKEVAVLFPGTTPVLGPAARREQLVGRDLEGHWLHLAVHAEASTMELTRLVLSDGYVSIQDIWKLNVKDAPLVVLSACETALGEQLPGDEVLSLARGFIQQGSYGVLSTLWTVNDESTRTFMKEFYQARTEGHAAALAVAQRALIRQGLGQYHWAPFVFNGM